MSTYQTIEQLYDKFLITSGVSTDSRSIEIDQFFIALKGDNFNGNEYADEALLNGALYAVVDEEKYATTDQHLLVEDGLTALQELANFHRKLIDIPILALTGSNGKTTTKELIAAVLSTTFNVAATVGNLNNHIGVPLTLLKMSSQHQMGIVEMGANHVGEITQLCHIAEPNFGLITNIGTAHIEGFGSQENIVKGKTELYNYIKENKKEAVFVNADDALLLSHSNDLNQITYGRTSDFFTGQQVDETIRLRLTVDDTEQDFTIQTHLFGEYNFYNALAAGAVGKHFGVPLLDIAEAIEQYKPKNNRSQIIEHETTTYIADAYNANISSMKLAVQQFAQIEATNKLAILGSMLEHGALEKDAHKEIVKLTESLALPAIFVGEEFKEYAPQQKWFSSAEEVAKYLSNQSLMNKTILLKGSRGIGLEKLIP